LPWLFVCGVDTLTYQSYVDTLTTRAVDTLTNKNYRQTHHLEFQSDLPTRALKTQLITEDKIGQKGVKWKDMYQMHMVYTRKAKLTMQGLC
jgi:DNA-binding transcriptional regulator YbjK